MYNEYGKGWWPKHKPVKKRRKKVTVPDELFRRVNVAIQIQSSGRVYPARLMLNDLNFSNMTVFTNAPIQKGSRVAFVMEQPYNLYGKGDVVWTVLYTLNTKIISSSNYHYRVGIRFRFETYQEQDAIRRYCEDILRGIPSEERK